MNKTETKTIIRSLLSSRNSGCGIYSLNKDFRDETGIDIPLFGYTSLSGFLESIPDTVKLVGMYPVQKVSLVGNNVSGHIVSLVKRQRRDKKSKKGISGNAGGNFFKNNRSKNSALIDKVSDCNKSLNPSQNRSSLQKVNTTPESKKPDEKANTKETEASGPKKALPKKGNHKPKNRRLFGNKVSTCKQMKLSKCETEDATLSSIALDLLRISDDFIEKDEGIAANDLKLHARVGHYVEVYPCDISHPTLFYFHLRPLKKALISFMEKLQQVYDKHEKIPTPKEVPTPNQIFAVRYSRHGGVAQWHRVQVEETLSSCLVVVRLIDYGTTAKVLVKNLRLLHRDFVSLPRQAVSGSLANIKPSGQGSEWSKAAVRRFHELAFCRDLVGGVVSIDHAACSLSMALSSTMGEEVHINDTLVEEGFAEFDLEVIQSDAKSETERNDSTVKACLPSPVFFWEKQYLNNRLQKMFTDEK